MLVNVRKNLNSSQYLHTKVYLMSYCEILVIVTGDLEFPIVSQDWPHSGEIQATNLSITNKPGTHINLENLNFTIKPRETVS